MSAFVNSTVVPVAAFFKDQLTTDVTVQDVFYGVATVCLFLVVAGVGLIDQGLVRRKNQLDTWVQKIVCALIAGGALTIIGFAIWQWQYYEALAIPKPLQAAIDDWSIWGVATTTFATELDPKAYFEADVFQVFLAFFIAYAAVGGALLHSAGLERVKAAPMYIICFVAGALIIPIALYLTWGSASPLTNAGLHDYPGIYSLYIVVGVLSLIIAWRAGPRLGAFEKDDRTMGPVPHNMATSAFGVMLILFAVPFAFLGCGFLIAGSGYFGISLTSSGFGIVMVNIFMAFIGGGLGGAVIAYITKNPIMALLGAAAGYIGAGASLDVGKPLAILAVSFIASFVVYGTYLLLIKMRIDDKKIVPLALGGGIYSALAAGIVGAGEKTGGYFGITKGEYTFQHATISFGQQLWGVVVIAGGTAIVGLILVFILEKTIGLRVSEEAELEGLDSVYWGAPPPSDHDTGPVPYPGQAEAIAASEARHS